MDYREEIQGLKRKNRVFWVYEHNFNDLILNNSLVNFILGSTPFSYGKEVTPIMIQAIRDGNLIPHHFNKINPTKFNLNIKNPENETNFYIMGRVQVLQLQLESNLICESAKGIENKKFWKKEQFTDYSEAEINENDRTLV